MADQYDHRQGQLADQLGQALLDEDAAAQTLATAQQRVISVLRQARCVGFSWDKLARLVLALRNGRSPTIQERRREAARLRQVVHRKRVTGDHASLDSGRSGSARATVQCGHQQGVDRMPDTPDTNDRLIKRTVTVEEYEPSGFDGFFDADPAAMGSADSPPAPSPSPAPASPQAASPATGSVGEAGDE